MDRRRLVVAAGAVVALVVVAVAVTLARGDDDDGGSARPGLVDFQGVRFDVPDDYVVQDITGRVDGQLDCPDAPGYVFTDDQDRAFYTGATCDPPGDQVLVRIFLNPDMQPGQPAPPTTSPGGIEYMIFETTNLVFVESEVWVTVEGPGAEDVAASIAETSRPSPDDGLATPTTAEAETSTTDRLADELGCDTTEVAATYQRGEYAPFLGRQAEAPVDCYAGDDGFRILVLRDDEALGLAQGYYAESAWLVVGDRWAITAMSQEAAERAQERVGGEALPPDSCCGPPTSDSLPGER